MFQKIIVIFSLLIMFGCKDFISIDFGDEPVQTSDPIGDTVEPIKSREITPLWIDHKDGSLFTQYTRELLREHGNEMMQVVPRDIDKYCPEYKDFSAQEREDFYLLFFSAIAKHESNFNTNLQFREPFRDRNGRFVISRGLLQVSIESSRGYGCQMESASELHHPKKNLECGVRILNRWVDRHGYLGSRIGSSWRGGAMYWAVLRNTNNKHKFLVEDVRKSCFNSEKLKQGDAHGTEEK